MSLVIREAPFGTADFEACFQIRVTVFVAEQGIPLSDEQDEHDPSALHLLGTWDGQPAGTIRVLMNDGGAAARITRVAVLAPLRKRGIAAALIRQAEAMVPARRFTLNAQVQAIPFYALLGYVPEGEVFYEAGIPHRQMVKLAEGAEN